MPEGKLGPVELRFARIIWSGEPIPSGELVRRSEAELGWKKSTTYTILRRLCDRGLMRNEGGMVTSLVSEEEYQTDQSQRFVEETFAGSLPRFLAAFARRGKLSEGEIAEIQQLIEDMR